jgi:hypothetical protein
MRGPLAVCVGCLMMVFVTSLIAGSYFWIRASLNRRPGPSQRWYVTGNPLNAVLFRDELTPRGLEYRTKAFRAQIIALISIVILMLL